MQTCAEHGRTRLARERPKSAAQFLISTKTGWEKKKPNLILVVDDINFYRISRNLAWRRSYLAFAKIGKRRAVAV